MSVLQKKLTTAEKQEMKEKRMFDNPLKSLTELDNSLSDLDIISIKIKPETFKKILNQITQDVYFILGISKQLQVQKLGKDIIEYANFIMDENNKIYKKKRNSLPKKFFMKKLFILDRQLIGINVNIDKISTGKRIKSLERIKNMVLYILNETSTILMKPRQKQQFEQEQQKKIKIQKTNKINFNKSYDLDDIIGNMKVIHKSNHSNKLKPKIEEMCLSTLNFITFTNLNIKRKKRGLEGGLGMIDDSSKEIFDYINLVKILSEMIRGNFNPQLKTALKSIQNNSTNNVVVEYSKRFPDQNLINDIIIAQRFDYRVRQELTRLRFPIGSNVTLHGINGIVINTLGFQEPVKVSVPVKGKGVIKRVNIDNILIDMNQKIVKLPLITYLKFPKILHNDSKVISFVKENSDKVFSNDDNVPQNAFVPSENITYTGDNDEDEEMEGGDYDEDDALIVNDQGEEIFQGPRALNEDDFLANERMERGFNQSVQKVAGKKLSDMTKEEQIATQMTRFLIDTGDYSKDGLVISKSFLNDITKMKNFLKKKGIDSETDNYRVAITLARLVFLLNYVNPNISISILMECGTSPNLLIDERLVVCVAKKLGYLVSAKDENNSVLLSESTLVKNFIKLFESEFGLKLNKTKYKIVEKEVPKVKLPKERPANYIRLQKKLVDPTRNIKGHQQIKYKHGLGIEKPQYQSSESGGRSENVDAYQKTSIKKDIELFEKDDLVKNLLKRFKRETSLENKKKIQKQLEALFDKKFNQKSEENLLQKKKKLPYNYFKYPVKKNKIDKIKKNIKKYNTKYAGVEAEKFKKELDVLFGSDDDVDLNELN